MFQRLCEARLKRALRWSPAVAILGARQVGKTTLAKKLASQHADALYLDLERPQALAQLQEPEAFLAANRHRLVVLDEIQHVPDLFSVLRGDIDADRRHGRFLVLGSASFKLLQQSQSLAGRLALVDLQPLLLPEVMRGFADIQTLWLRGGFPGSYLAADSADAWDWREAFVRHFLHTDLAALGVDIDPQRMGRFWRMVAHLHGQIFNASAIAASLGVSQPTVVRYLDHLVQTLMLRRLEPFHVNVGKRLVKSPKVYVRDSGLLHYLLNLRDVNDLLGHPATGASWEGFVIEQICNQLPSGASVSFYRTAAGAELDLVVEHGGRTLGFEVKFSTAPKPTKGFWQACADIHLDAAYVVAPVQHGWPMKSLTHCPVQVIGPHELPPSLRE